MAVLVLHFLRNASCSVAFDAPPPCKNVKIMVIATAPRDFSACKLMTQHSAECKSALQHRPAFSFFFFFFLMLSSSGCCSARAEKPVRESFFFFFLHEGGGGGGGRRAGGGKTKGKVMESGRGGRG